MTHAVVLVGGFGTRLRPLTYRVPKPMLPVGHRPMIVGLVDRLVAGGVDHVVLALGFRPEPFEAAFEGGRYGDVTITYVVEPEPLGTGGAIAFAARSAGIDDTFVVANGDIITDASVADLIAHHRRVGVEVTLDLTPVADPSAYGVAELDGPVITRFVEKPQPGESDSCLINAGTYVFEPSVIDRISAGQMVSIERDIFPDLVAANQVSGHISDDYWIDTGTPDTFRQANLDLVTGVRATTVDAVAPDAVVDESVKLTNSLVGDGAHIGADCRLVGSVILPGARLGTDVEIVDSIVAGQIGSRARIVNSVIATDAVIDDGEVITDVRLPQSPEPEPGCNDGSS